MVSLCGFMLFSRLASSRPHEFGERSELRPAPYKLDEGLFRKSSCFLECFFSLV